MIRAVDCVSMQPSRIEEEGSGTVGWFVVLRCCCAALLLLCNRVLCVSVVGLGPCQLKLFQSPNKIEPCEGISVCLVQRLREAFDGVIVLQLPRQH